MRRLVPLIAVLAACSIERRPPVSERAREESHILAALYAFYDTVGPARTDTAAAGRPRLVRSDFRLHGNLAAAWVVTATTSPADPGIETEQPEVLLLRRRGDGWEVVAHAHSAGP